MSCDNFKNDLLAYHYDELPPERRAEVEKHLAQCEDCRREMDELVETLGDIRKLPSQEVNRMAYQNALTEIRVSERTRAPLGIVRYLAAAAGIALLAGAFLVFSMFSDVKVAEGDAYVKTRGYQVTIFNDDLAMVKDSREIFNLRKGENILEVDGIPAEIMADTVHFKDLDDPAGSKVLEQNYEFDLASAWKILDKYKYSGDDSRKITVKLKDGSSQTGFLMYGNARDLSLGLKVQDGSVKHFEGGEVESVRMDSVPENLRAKPTLVWNLDAAEPGNHQAEIGYLTGGLDWSADYRITFTGDNTLDLSGWVTVRNYSGVTFPDAKLKLMAGDVNRVRDYPDLDKLVEAESQGDAEKRENDGGFVEKSFAEYHLYTLGRTTSLKDRQVKQIEFASRSDVQWKKVYKYDYQVNPGGVTAFCVFKNEKENNLGLPLPKGKIRFFAEDTFGDHEYAGGASIDHTPRDEELKLRMGVPFDITAKKELVDRKVISKDEQELTIRLTIVNHKDEEDIVVNAYERWSRGIKVKFLKEPPEMKKENSTAVVFPVEVKAGEKTVVEYTINVRR